MARVLALTKDGRMTYCSAKPENRGKGRCNHVTHQRIGESVQDFIDRANDILLKNKTETDELIDIKYLKNGLNDLDKRMEEAGLENITINVVGGFCTYSITSEATRDIDSITKLDTRIKEMVHAIADESNGNLEEDWLNDDIAYFDDGNIIRRQVIRYLNLHPEEFKENDDSDFSNMKKIKIKKASNDAIICMKYASIKGRIKAKDVNDLSALIKHSNYNGKDLQRLLKHFGVDVEMDDLASDLYMMGVIKTEDEYLDLLK